MFGPRLAKGGSASTVPRMPAIWKACCGTERPSMAQSAEEHAKKLSNPVARLISVPMQFDDGQGIGTANGNRSFVNVRPVVPFSSSTDWSEGNALEMNRPEAALGANPSLERPRKRGESRKQLIRLGNLGVADGTRTHDNRNHNPGLYQLSYSHH